MMLEFKEEMLIPKINGDVYFSIFELENWLRRICLTAYMIEYGDDWLKSVPKRVFEGYIQRTNRNQELFYFDADNEDNLIWSLTHAELSQLLLENNIYDRVHYLIGFSKERFSQKLNELREIRNILAHNRALSERTGMIVKGIIASMHLAIDKFKTHILYNGDYNIIWDDETNEVGEYFNLQMEGNDWGKFQAFIEENEYLYTLACLPVDRPNIFPSGVKLLKKYKNVIDCILSIQINKQGAEYLIIFSKKLSVEKCKVIINIFLQKDDVWTNRKFEEQHPRYICHPKLWFYENQRPIEE
ncbi:hypothetical protein [Paenibacillus sp.]|uniref:hypothetical protein n=1 Tax=Paenibacillus sp. TaxID=58172 RepID=UPI0028A9ED41|nr:hypothetical protein [Paenibacillus sp.]